LLSSHPYCASYTAASPIVGFAFDSQVGIHAFGSDRRVDFRTKANGLAYVPEGCDVYSRSDVGGEYLRIALRPEPGESPAPRFSDRIDRAAINAAHALRRMLLADAARDPLACERLVHVLKERAVMPGERPLRPAAWMTPRRLRLVDELIEARLDSGLTVEQIATTLGLSAGFFTRAFKAAIGKSPHDHIIDRRLARARTLLRRGTEPDLGAIALASGFASHAHMTATFRRRLGVAPSELRRDHPPHRAR
jgi:AraC family transcriptional regulator